MYAGGRKHWKSVEALFYIADLLWYRNIWIICINTFEKQTKNNYEFLNTTLENSCFHQILILYFIISEWYKVSEKNLSNALAQMFIEDVWKWSACFGYNYHWIVREM